MGGLPSSQTLAELVSRVTQTMFGMSFALSDASTLPWKNVPPWKTVLLPISGSRPITVAIASDELGGTKLGATMFSCPPDQVDSTMITDSLCELANIVAGQVKRTMGLDQALGLPTVAEEKRTAAQSWHGATLSNGSAEVRVWVAISEAAV